MAQIATTSRRLASISNAPSDGLPGGGDKMKGVKYLVDTAPNMRALPPEYVLPVPPMTAGRDAEIPVIDLSGLDGPMIDRRTLTVQAISSACAEWGFFRIINHGIKTCLMEEELKAVEELFNLPWEEKMKYASDDVMNPVRYGTSLNTSKQHDLHWRDYLRHFGHPFHKTFHLWPKCPSNYRDVAKEYLEELWKLALKIVGAISEGLGLDQDYIEKLLGEGCQIAAFNYYPPCPEPDRTLGLAAHSDHGGVIILMENDVTGLQVKHNETWVTVQHVPGSWVVNIGDYTKIPSNGRYKSVEHQAVVNAERKRISIGVSLGPEMIAIAAPASQLLDEESKMKYKPVTYKDYMRFQQSKVMRAGKSPLQALMITSNNNASENDSSTPPLVS